MQIVLQDQNHQNIPGTASGWISQPGWMRTHSTNTYECLGSGNQQYQTEVQISATHRTYGYSGIEYAYSSTVTKACT